MKQVYKCEYCNFIGTEEEVRDHEQYCINNPEVHCCANCSHCSSCTNINSSKVNYACHYCENLDMACSKETQPTAVCTHYLRK